jgi:hypothetical protein
VADCENDGIGVAVDGGEELIRGNAGFAPAKRRGREAKGIAAGIACSADFKGSAAIGAAFFAQQLQC